MNIEKFCKIIGKDFYTGVPDSQLKALCDYLIDIYGMNNKHHIIAANEGNSTALAAGYHLATGKIPVVYLQNSGEGNIINPVVSLLNKSVYGIPAIFIIGWRGEPGEHDEPQHIFQGKITEKLLEDIDIQYSILDKETTEEEITNSMVEFNASLKEGKSVAFIIKKGALSYEKKNMYSNNYIMKREEIIKHILEVSDQDPIISTTGKASREVFEIREDKEQGHQYDFLTVGSMGHASSIALGVALNKPEKKIWCIDGDGAALMHMGAIATVGAIKPPNLIHIIINNEAHETVGGMKTVGDQIDFVSIAKGCGYPIAVSVKDFSDLDRELKRAKTNETLTMIEVKCAIGSRSNLGRPTTTAFENKVSFMNYLKE